MKKFILLAVISSFGAMNNANCDPQVPKSNSSNTTPTSQVIALTPCENGEGWQQAAAGWRELYKKERKSSEELAEALKAAQTRYAEEIARGKERQEFLNTNVPRVEKCMKQLRERCEQTERENEELIEQINLLQKQLDEKYEQFKNMQSPCTVWKTQFDKVTGQLEDLYDQNATLRNQQLQTKIRLDRDNRKLNLAYTSLLARQKGLLKELELANQQIEELELQLKELELANQQLEKKRTTGQDTIRKYLNRIKDMRKEINTLSSALEQQEQIIKTLQQTITDQADQISSLAGEKAALQQQITDQAAEISALAGENAASNAENTKLKTRIRNVRKLFFVGLVAGVLVGIDGIIELVS